ncbi:hypothetical protein COCC4DRAFT_200625 [Bipolaris maydis ATCC 48331]|uniref:Uncharacterized protein n=2 Tax=Cochliobolus heterostrophus TaxID=5016 RepID=M2TK16_COCH5|nr:uncharacterized protein COCC4DRAFT_200625 [Bipolaris maydis ATCC 48331]EMD86814.1 hypothetical protein COCHEDRAFT_1115233 [Bipolaris maydis C5]KAJ5047775.1 hypothetical protein J3E74DRAFT_283386 [Bipolaris maydis]ENI03201.1 hypothetical protein COCC4DRAFT_200625 [Bipolaris maydis ATCC 48331]KAJ5052480.1 hypothetical protein J3E74DRAFT_21671 [Bipolaris maydis]KAJ6192166.1 hypothetical protein J3E72DRAFT_21098 [Bipolaris maydis]
MNTSKAVDRNPNGHEERLSADEKVGKAFSRPASHAAATCSHDPKQYSNQRDRIPQLILAMAALRLENNKIEEMIKREYEVLDPIRIAGGSEHADGLYSEYVVVDE